MKAIGIYSGLLYLWIISMGYADTSFDFDVNVPEIHTYNWLGGLGTVELISGPTNPDNMVLRMDHGAYGIGGIFFASIEIPERHWERGVIPLRCSLFVPEGSFNTFGIGVGESHDSGEVIGWNDFGVLVSFTEYDGIRIRSGEAYLETGYDVVPRGRWFDCLIIANKEDRRYAAFVKSSDSMWTAISISESATTSQISDYSTLVFRNGESYDLKKIFLFTSDDPLAYGEFPLHDWFIDNVEILDDVDSLEDDIIFQWRGYPNNEGWVHLEGWLGWAFIAQAPWIWSKDFGWIYMPKEENLNEVSGTWVYFLK